MGEALLDGETVGVPLNEGVRLSVPLLDPESVPDRVGVGEDVGDGVHNARATKRKRRRDISQMYSLCHTRKAFLRRREEPPHGKQHELH